LRIAAKVDPADQAYFESTIEPLLDDPLVTYVGEIGDHEKNDFIGNARALLMPIDWPEPFGLVMIEAMACGTPVIAYRHGSVPEIIDHGITGFVVENQEEAIAMAKNIDRIDRRRCRQEFEQRFAASVMARHYLDVYRDLVNTRVTAQVA
jgi:glycosyltransferase involved in cell wall biosynthesis